MKDKLNFDVTDANTIADSDSVGAYVRSSDGTLITHSTVGGKEALDVSIADGINVEVDLSHVDDSVRLGDGTSFFTSTSENGDVALDVHLSNSSIAVTATDLDIRDLAFATDSVDVSGSSVTVSATDLDIRDISHTQDSIQIGDGTEIMLVNADGSINSVVTATDLDIRDLVAATDSVSSHMFDGAGTALTSTLVGADQALDVNLVNTISINDAALADTAIVAKADTLAAAGTAELAVASALADRKYLFIRNNDNRVMYVGGSGVDAATGFPVSPGSVLELRAGASSAVYYDSGKTGHAIRTLELS